jgi:hypothetical protein
MLANGIAIYGGHDNTVSGNLVQDTGITQGGGIQVGQRFTSTPVGTTTISNNTMIRDCDLDPNWQFGVGALWFDGSQGAITGPVNVTNALIEQSPYEAVQWVEGTVSGVSLNNVAIAGTGTFALQEQTGGTATFSNVTATGVNGPAAVYSCEGGRRVHDYSAASPVPRRLRHQDSGSPPYLGLCRIPGGLLHHHPHDHADRARPVLTRVLAVVLPRQLSVDPPADVWRHRHPATQLDVVLRV